MDAFARGQIHFINTIGISGVLTCNLPGQSNAADFNGPALLRPNLLNAIACSNEFEVVRAIV